MTLPVGAVVAATSFDTALAFLELGLLALGLSVLARLSDRVGISPIPAYLLLGLLFGQGGLAAPTFSAAFIDMAAEIGVLLLLLTLGLEYTGPELGHGLRTSWLGGLLDLGANFTPGAVAALLLGWGATEAVLLGGVTYISSSGVISKLLSDLDRMGNRETPTILSILVIEDLVMAAYLPVLGVLLAGRGVSDAFSAVAVALALTAAILFVALRFGFHISSLLAGRTDESILLGVLGATLLVAGMAQVLEISAAVGAFLFGLALSGTVQERATRLITPLRDLFAATFFLLFGLRIDPAALPDALPIAAALAVVTALTKVAVGVWAAGRAGVSHRGRMRTGTALIARGEFSIVIAGLAVVHGVGAEAVSVAAAYVLLLAAGGPIITRFADPLADRIWRTRPAVPASVER